MVSLYCWAFWCVAQVVLSLLTKWTWNRTIRLVEMGSFRYSDCQCLCRLCHGGTCDTNESGKKTFFRSLHLSRIEIFSCF